MYTVDHYCTPTGRDVIGEWFDRLVDRQAEARMLARINRLRAGNFGDCKPCREGVWELRIDWGAGYRVYYARVGRAVILLLCGGAKQTQDSDIKQAIGYLKDFKRRVS
ncbi:MAG: type II toxin-antitoxin system RelE/ParE family toxin [Gammaproteobacteria bacterium]